MNQEKKMALDFIEALVGRRDAHICFRHYCDYKEQEGVYGEPENYGYNPQCSGNVEGPLDSKWEELRELNNKGQSICFTVNETDGVGVKAKNITGLRALFIDDDHNREFEFKPECLPSIINQSAHGVHVYFKLKPGEDLLKFREAQKGIAAYFKTDTVINDPSRVFRVPGFLNCKTPNAPVLVTTRELHPEREYTIDQILAAYPPPPEEANEPINLNSVSLDETRENKVNEASKYVKTFPKAQKGERNNRGLVLSGALTRGFDLNDEDALALLSQWNVTLDVPMKNGELQTLIKSGRGLTEPLGARLSINKTPSKGHHRHLIEPTPHVGYHIDSGGYFVFYNGAWESNLLDETQAAKWCYAMGTSRNDMQCIRSCDEAIRVFKRTDFLPGQPPIVTDGKLNVINTYVPPVLQLSQGTYPILTKILQRLVNYDEASEHYFLNWLAFKVQNPEKMNNHGIVFVGSSGTGKSSLIYAIFQILGKDNCRKIEQADLDKVYNSHYISKCFINANEIHAPKGSPEAQSARLKEYLAGESVMVEQKNVSRYSITNHSSWIFSSNREDSLFLDSYDRRYTVFNDGLNQRDCPQEHQAHVSDLWLPGNTPSPVFVSEMASFGYYLKNKVIDYSLIKQPMSTSAKRDMIGDYKDSSTDFIEQVNIFGIDKFVADYGDAHPITKTWVWERDVSSDMIYKAYSFWCSNNGRHPVSSIRFGRAARNAGWIKDRKFEGHTFKDVPRSPSKPDLKIVDSI
jgi:hypothetical protein